MTRVSQKWTQDQGVPLRTTPTLQVWTREDLAESDAANMSAEADLIADEEAPQDQSELALE